MHGSVRQVPGSDLQVDDGERRGLHDAPGNGASEGEGARAQCFPASPDGQQGRLDSHAYPAFAEMVRFNRAHEEAKVLSSQPGQEGKALVGIGKYKWDTLQDLYEATGADRIKYVRSMRTQTPRYPGSAMAALIDYIQRRDQEGVAAVAGHAAANTIPASNTRPNSAAYASWSCDLCVPFKALSRPR